MARFSGGTYSAAVDESKRLIALAMLGITKYDFDKTTNKLTLYMQDGTVVEAALTADSSSGNVGEAVEDKCIAPWKAGETYQKDVSLVIYNGYIYSCSVTNKDAVFTESHWTKLADSFDELSVEDVKAMLNLSQEELDNLQSLIDDTTITTTKTNSSSKIYMDIQAAIAECKDDTLKQIAKKVSGSYKIAASTSDVTSADFIYLINNGVNYDLYVLVDSVPTRVGDTSVNFDNYYTKTETDSDFLKKTDATSTYATITTVDGKVDKTNVLTTTSTTATDDQVYSAKVMNTELNGVVKKTDISTAIDNTSTNDTVPTNKAVYDSLLNKVNNTIVLTTADEVNSFDMVYQSFVIGPSVAEAVGLPKAPDSTWFCINLSHFKGFKYPSQIAFEYAGIERIMYRTAHNGVWHNWRKIPTTSVSDIPMKFITALDDSTNYKNHSGNKYYVKDGICECTLYIDCTTPSDVAVNVLSGLPMPNTYSYFCIHAWDPGFSDYIMAEITPDGILSLKKGTAGGSYLGTFSYMVKE